MIARLRDWKTQIAQVFLPLLIIPVVVFLDLPRVIVCVLTKVGVEIQAIDTSWRIIIGLGKWPFALSLLGLTYYKIRKHNKGIVLKQNLPQRIVWHSYAGYWFCRRILNYQILSLTRVPIPMQFKLVWRDLFRTYEYMDGVTEKEKGTDEVRIEQFQNESVTSTINLVLADTYPLDWKSKLPATVMNLTTLVIDRIDEKGVRYYSPDFVAKIATMIHELPNNVVTINLFSTINAAHCYHITKEVFMTGGRDSLKHLYVYEQSKGSWVFEGKNLKIF